MPSAASSSASPAALFFVIAIVVIAGCVLALLLANPQARKALDKAASPTRPDTSPADGDAAEPAVPFAGFSFDLYGSPADSPPGDDGGEDDV